jgi:PAS domain S-box-containing protein
MYDITEQKNLEEQIRAAEAKRRALIEQIPGIVYVWPMGDSGEEPFVSAAVESVLGCTREQWLNENWWLDHIHEEDRDQVLSARAALDTASEPVEIEYRIRLEADHLIWVDEVAQVLMRDGQPWVLQGVLGDITKRKEAEEQMAFLAFHDVLTGLPNRAMFDEHLRMAISRAEQKASVVAVLYVDLDELKRNERHDRALCRRRVAPGDGEPAKSRRPKGRPRDGAGP